MSSERFSACSSIDSRDTPRSSRLLKERTIDAPTMKRKLGKTRSVSVHPFHAEWRSCAYETRPSPALLTRIMSATVRPRRTSNDSSRSRGLALDLSNGPVAIW